MNHDSQDAEEEAYVAAALAAVRILLAEETVEQPVPAQSRWRAAALLEAHNLPGTSRASWGQVERAGRAERWSKGIV